MPTLHLMVGLPCSGKTTRAKEIAAEYRALRLTPDEWHLRLFGEDWADPNHDRNHETIEAVMWDVAVEALGLGVDVVLDFGFWSREERDIFRARAAALGVGFRLHYTAVPVEELYRRLEQRNSNLPKGAFPIPKPEMDKYIPLFQPPEPDELQ